MNTVLLNIKTDNQTKHDLKAFTAELGMTTTTFVNVLIRQALRDRRVTLTTQLEPTPYLEAIMRQADDDLEHDRAVTHTHSPEAALAHLDSLMR